MPNSCPSIRLVAIRQCEFDLHVNYCRIGLVASYAPHSEHVGNWNPVRRKRHYGRGKRQFLSQQQPPSKQPAKWEIWL